MVGDDDFYRSDLSDLHKEVAPEILPKDLGWGHDHKEEQYYCYYALKATQFNDKNHAPRLF